MSPTKLDAALDAVRRGFTVFPIVENTKVPRDKGWQNLATRNEHQVRELWAQHPNDNIGATTNKLIVADVDPRNGGAGTFAALAAIEEFPKTARHKTQGGGDHIIYAAPDGPVKGGNNKLGKGIDIKARGGYILLPGSTINGRKYERANDRPIAKAPPWIVEQCKRAGQKPDQAGKRIVEEDEEAIERATQWMLDKASTAETGNIDNTTYKVAARLYDFGVTYVTALEIMIEWNEVRCFPPQDMEDLERVVESASRNRENAIGSAHSKAHVFEAYEMPGTETRIPAPAGMQLESYEQAAAKALSNQAEPLIKGVLDRMAMSILYGESNTGKTFVAVDIAFHIAAKLKWAGRKTRPGCVVYVAAEGGRGVYKRLAALKKHYPQHRDVPLYIIQYPVDLLHGPEHGKELVKLCRSAAEQSGQPLELIVVDTLSRAMSGGDENSSTDMGAMVKSFDALRDVLGAHLMVIHHSGKDRARGARGHSLLRAATDTEIEVERGKITVKKQRDMEGNFRQRFSLKTVILGRDEDGAPLSSCIVSLAAPGAKEPSPLTPKQQEVLDAITKALGEDRANDTFDSQFVRRSKLEMGLEMGNSDSALSTMLSNIVEAGWMEKLQDNQYVLA